MNDDLLIQRYLDGKLANDELAALNQRLREDAALRQHFRTVAEQAVAFGDMVRRETDTLVCRPIPKPDRSVWFTTLALAASIALLATSAWFFLHSAPSPVVTLIEHEGSVAWKNGDAIQSGESLPAGTLETIGEASSALLRFRDGSLISLHGEAEFSFSDEGQKVLKLSRGTLSAEVQKQPAGRPMLIRTPSAVAEVVGTAFDLTARPEDTLLKVDEGLVKLKRLADGSQIDVPANRSAVASLAASDKLDAASTPEPLTAWSFDFTTNTPPRDWRGYAKNGTMHASPYVAKKLPDGRIITHHGISIRTAMLEQPLRLLVTETSVIRYRLRQQQPGDLLLMLLTNEVSGNHGGNFECKIRAEDLTPGPDGWCEISIPISRYKPVDPRPHIRKRHPSATGNILTSAIINTYTYDRQLEISHFELSPR
jgi:ferric-dicitrate binding protein FerR (iron transport regulator)